MRCAAVIPVFDHERAVGAVLDGLAAAGLHCFVVDDGSGETCARELDRLAAARPALTLVRLPRNLGKGGAVVAGLRAAHTAGYTHALQIDADGQHAVADAPRFLTEAAAHPDAVICGRPVFDTSIPRVRLYGRYITHALVWLNTLSFEIPDTMCGFRVYPLAPIIALVDRVAVGRRMDFDIEILVRLHWDGQPMVWLPTRVSYPADGVSHFRLWLDNALISRAHARLFAGMVLRLPLILARRLGALPRPAPGA
jgi:glycosyltransferase involved in cell wall biosynthesis